MFEMWWKASGQLGAFITRTWRGKIAYRNTLPIQQRPNYPDSDVPDEAIRNLRTIALITMTLIATIARTLKDWPDIPSEGDSHYEPNFYYRPNGWRTEDTL